MSKRSFHESVRVLEAGIERGIIPRDALDRLIDSYRPATMIVVDYDRPPRLEHRYKVAKPSPCRGQVAIDPFDIKLACLHHGGEQSLANRDFYVRAKNCGARHCDLMTAQALFDRQELIPPEWKRFSSIHFCAEQVIERGAEKDVARYPYLWYCVSAWKLDFWYADQADCPDAHHDGGDSVPLTARIARF